MKIIFSMYVILILGRDVEPNRHTYTCSRRSLRIVFVRLCRFSCVRFISGIYRKVDTMDTGVRKNTLKLCFESGAKAPTHVEVLGFVIGTLKLGAGDLHSVYKDENDGHFFIKMMDEPTFTEYCGRLEEMYPFVYDDGTRVPCMLDVASRIFRYVRIFNLPPEVDDKAIGQVLGQFGTIRQHVRERYPASYNLPIYNGIRGVHMEIAKEIPPSLFIGHFRARIFSDGLKNRCFYCKEEGHLKSSCPKLAASSSGSGGSRTYSNVTAQGRPAPVPVPKGPVLNVPAITPIMQRLEKAAQEPNKQPKPTSQPEGPTSKPTAAESTASAAPEGVPQNSPVVENPVAGPSSTPEERMEIVETIIVQKPEDNSIGDNKNLKRAADSSPSSATDSQQMEEDGKPDNFQKAKGKRNKKGKKSSVKNTQKPIETITTRSFLKANK